MRRRAFLTAVTAGLGGCAVLGERDGVSPPPVLDDPPSGVYRPTRTSGVRVVDTAEAGDFRFGLLYSYPSRFWEVVGRERYRRSPAAEDSIHLMTLVWDPETGVVLPDVGLTVEVRQGGSLVVQEAVYAMLSQRLGFHYGDNVTLPGDGEYTVRVRVGGLAIRRTGSFAGRFGDSVAVDVPFAYRRADRDALDRRRLDDAGGDTPLAPAETPGVPTAVAPPVSTLPGHHLGRATSDDVVFDAVLFTDDAARRLGAEEAYLGVLARTPQNGLVLPAMGLSARVVRDGAVSVDGTLSRTVDPVLGYHYGTAVPELTAGDRVELSTLTPPQVARHEGYETAFVDVDPVTVTVA